MGMTILQAKQRLHDKWMELTKNGTDEEMMQALCIADTVLGDYDESLKADMVAMLEEIKLKITEKSYYDTTIIGNYEDEVRVELVELDDVNEIIQDKINTLEVEDGNK